MAAIADLVASLGGNGGGGEIAPLPHCPVHGQVHRETDTRSLPGGMLLILRAYWTCPGWDGEGCGYEVDENDLDWRPASEDELQAAWR